jgi:hypothetical protein
MTLVIALVIVAGVMVNAIVAFTRSADRVHQRRTGRR